MTGRPTTSRDTSAPLDPRRPTTLALVSRRPRRTPYRPPAASEAPSIAVPRLARGGVVHRLLGELTGSERADFVDTIGLKHCQRIGHRHRIPELRSLRSFDEDRTVVDRWLVADDAEGGSRAFGDLLAPWGDAMVSRARELLGEHADEPEVEHLRAMADALTAERSLAQARLFLAAVVEWEFTAAPAVRELASTDERFAVPPAPAAPS